jgi:hypothetical protein
MTEPRDDNNEDEYNDNQEPLDDGSSCSESSYEDGDDDSESDEGSCESERQTLVSFSSNASVRDIPNMSCYSASQIRSMWFNKDEFLFMRRTRKALMDRMKREESFTIMDHNAHGLYTQEQESRRQAIVWNAQLAVMTEQQFQWDDDVDDPESISQMYYECTSLCQWEAIQRARLLARRVEEFEDDEDDAGDEHVEHDQAMLTDAFHSSCTMLTPTSTKMSPRARRKGPRSKTKSLPESAPPPVVEFKEEEDESPEKTNINKVTVLNPAFAKRVRSRGTKPFQRKKTRSLPDSFKAVRTA